MKQFIKASVFGLVVVTGMNGCASVSGTTATYEGAKRAAHEVAILNSTEQTQLMSVDGRETSRVLLSGNNQTFELLPGERTLLVRYVEIFHVNADEHEVIRSKPVAIRMMVKAGESYRFDFKRPSNLVEAREFIKSPKIDVIAMQSGQRAESVAIKSYAQASLLDTISKSLNADEGAASKNLDSLKLLWDSATADERVEFRRWIDSR